MGKQQNWNYDSVIMAGEGTGSHKTMQFLQAQR